MLWRRTTFSAGSASAGRARGSGIGSSQCVRGRVSRTELTDPAGPSSSGRARRERSDSASRQTFVAMRYSQVRSDARPSKRSRPRQARTMVSCTASSASTTEPSMR